MSTRGHIWSFPVWTQDMGHAWASLWDVEQNEPKILPRPRFLALHLLPAASARFTQELKSQIFRCPLVSKIVWRLSQLGLLSPDKTQQALQNDINIQYRLDLQWSRICPRMQKSKKDTESQILTRTWLIYCNRGLDQPGSQTTSRSFPSLVVQLPVWLTDQPCSCSHIVAIWACHIKNNLGRSSASCI